LKQIKHGFRQSEERINTIVISGAMEDGFAVMEITDNGDGIRAENPEIPCVFQNGQRN
jgi:LytS/YehU family sensor histidine kinase